MPTIGLAHSGAALGLDGLVSGLVHPLSGADHLLAMLAVGLWAAQLGPPAIWLLPITFPSLMALGGLLSILGLPLPVVESVIAASNLVLGLVIALAFQPSTRVAALVIGLFSIFHGYAHGTELPKAADPIAYEMGFILSTAGLHLLGILIGTLKRWPVGARALRVSGAIIASTGVVLLLGSR